MDNKVFLSTKNLTKKYGPITVLDKVSVDFNKGEIHALIGENGAGKSTLCKMISGAISPFCGEMEVDGETVLSFTPMKAKEAGIGMVYQEFNLVPELTIYENLFVGKEITKASFIDKKAMIRKSEDIFEKMGIDIDCRRKISNLSVAYCQLVEIAKALLENSKLLILDEPTAPLTNKEVEILFKVLNQLKDDGISMIYISHRLEEIFRLCDKITVLRDGEFIKTMNVKDTNQEKLINLMIGRELSKEFPDRLSEFNYKKAETILRVENLNNQKLKDVSFQLKKGEILGLAGLVGAGRTEVARAIFGADKIASGTISINEKPIQIKSPTVAIKNGIALIPEDRKQDGLMLDLSNRTNMSIVVIKELTKGSMVSPEKETELIDKYVEMLSIKTPSIESPVSNLSGGNQQKIVLAKWLATGADILIFDEPTRGIDVGAKRDIYNLLFELKEAGKSIIIISSEMSEILNLCDRVIVMHEGKLSGELGHKEATQEKIMTLGSGLKL